MEKDNKYKLQPFNDLNTKNNQLHAQRLKKLQIQVAPHYSTFDITTNSKYIKTQTQKYNPLNQTNKKQIIITPVQKHTYFHNQSLKNIDQQNKILFKKIQRIVKGNKNKRIQFNKNQQKHSRTFLNHFQDDKSESQINTTFMAEEMNKNRASRVQSKQREIRDANLKMLERLMNMKPTISTRKILTQTQKNKEAYKKLSRFNVFLSTDSESERDSIKGSGDKKRYFSETRQKQQGEICKDCNYHTLINKKKFSAGYTNDFEQNKKNINSHRRTATQPIEHHSQIKLPYIISPSNSHNFITMAINDIADIYGPNRSKSTNNRYNQSSTYEQNKSVESKSLTKQKRSNQFNNDTTHKGHQTTTNKSTKNLIIQSNQSLKEPFNQNKQEKKIIVLGRVQKLIENQLVNFVFIRSPVLYEIHIHQKRRSVSSNEKPMKKKKGEEIPHQLKQHYIGAKTSSAKQSQSRKNVKEFIEQRNQFKYPEGIINPLKQSRIILNETVGSQLFSYFDYDYNRIIEECLELRKTFDDKIEVQLKEELYNFKEPKITTKYNNQSIKENEQDEEED